VVRCGRRNEGMPNGCLQLVAPDPSDDQAVWGPIQDDEALFLFALIRTARMRRILEVGGLDGYSATNFLRATGDSGQVYTVDLNPVPKVAENHYPICKNAGDIQPQDVGSEPLDLVFFDCHVYPAQASLFNRLRSAGIITEETVLAWHDTGFIRSACHRTPTRSVTAGSINRTSGVW
jgi:predicted O-methyltransferase YrrM